MTAAAKLMWALAAIVAVFLAVSAGVNAAIAAPPLPEGPDGKTVRPTVSYSYTWFATDGRALMMRVPAHGRRRATLRGGGPMGES